MALTANLLVETDRCTLDAPISGPDALRDRAARLAGAPGSPQVVVRSA